MPPLTPSCSIPTLDGGACSAPTHPRMPFPVCSAHAVQLWRHVNKHMDHLVGGSEDAGPTPRVAKTAVRKIAPNGRSTAVVYYLRIGELIKIGTTNNLNQRLKAYPPDREVLALERGGTGLEALRLRQFRHLLAGRREWFTPADDLLAHIDQVRARAGKVPA